MKKNRFIKYTLIYLGTLVSAIIIVIIVLWNFLASYEKSLTENTVEKFIEEMQTGNSCLSEKTEYCSKGLENQKKVFKCINKKSKKQHVSYNKEVKSSSPDNPVYTILFDDEPAISLTLEKGEKVGFNFSSWDINKVELLESLAEVKDLKIIVPEGYKVYINNISVEKYGNKKENGIELLSNLIEQKVIKENIVYDEYNIDTLYSEPEIMVLNQENKEIDLVCEDGTNYMVDYYAEQSFINEVERRVQNIIEPYAKYFSRDGSFSDISKYLLNGTELYNRILNSDVKWFGSHSGYKFENKKISDYKKYSENCFSCNVYFEQIIFSQYGEKKYESDLTWIFINRDGAWYLADMVTNNSNKN